MFGNFNKIISFNDYCRVIKEFVQMDMQKTKLLFMQLIVDMNKDGVVCDADIFNCFKLTSSEMS